MGRGRRSLVRVDDGAPRLDRIGIRLGNAIRSLLWLLIGVPAWLAVVTYTYTVLFLVALVAATILYRPWRIHTRLVVLAVGAALISATPVIFLALARRSQVAWNPAIGRSTIVDVAVNQ